jgi:hypothetical protein
MRLIVQPGRGSTLNGFNEIPPLLDIASQTILQSESDLSSQLNGARKMRSRDLPEARPAGAVAWHRKESDHALTWSPLPSISEPEAIILLSTFLGPMPNSLPRTLERDGRMPG